MENNNFFNEKDISGIIEIYMKERGIERLAIMVNIGDNNEMHFDMFGGLK